MLNEGWSAMPDKFDFDNYSAEAFAPKRESVILPEIKSETNPALVQDPEKDKKKINFIPFPKSTKEVLEGKPQSDEMTRFLREEPIAIPSESIQSSSYLSLVLSPNLRELELMIRGLEYVKRFNPISGQEEVILRKIEGHPLNDYGINQIMQNLKIYCSPEIKLGRKHTKDYYNSVQHVSRSIIRLIYKNLKNFGMDTQTKQRNAKAFCNAIIEMLDASYSRSIEGKENDLSRATEFKIEGGLDNLNDPARLFNKQQLEKMKN